MIERVIENNLAEMESEKNVRVLLAVEAGSRAWGFASPNSDYDVRFIYVRPGEEYLRLEKRSDTIEWQLDEGMDMNGWDLQKALLLLHASNPTLFEWNNSPICYMVHDYWQSIKEKIDTFFQPKAGFFHYLGMAKTTYKKELQGDEVKLKKYFHAIRSILAAKWILEKKTPPPVSLLELMAYGLPATALPTFYNLYSRKIEKEKGLGVGKPLRTLNNYIEKSIEDLSQKEPDLPTGPHVGWQQLDEMFLRGLDAFPRTY